MLVGSRAWLSQHGVPIPPELEGHAASLEWQGKTVVFVAGGREAKGVLAVADAVRPEAREAVATMHRCCYFCCCCCCCCAYVVVLLLMMMLVLS